VDRRRYKKGFFMNSSVPRKRLPVHPSLEHLQKQAKRLAKQNPSLKLAEAQHQLAREYGCRNWAELARVVETMRQGGDQLQNVKIDFQPIPNAARKADRAAIQQILQERTFTQHDLDQGLAHALWYEEHGTWEDRKAVADLLLEHGADPDGQYGSNYGPIVLGTCECLHPAGLRYFIEAGADVSFPPIQTKYGSVCPLGSVLGTYGRGRNERKHEMINLLLRHGAYLPPEVTPPLLAIHRGDAAELAGLLDQDPGLLTRLFPDMPYGNIELKGASLLHCAVEFGETGCLSLLLDRGADINLRSAVIDGIGGQTPFFHAIATVGDGNFYSLEYLLKRLASRIDMSIRATWRDSGKGVQSLPMTPLEYAEHAATANGSQYRKRIEEELRLLRSLDLSAKIKTAICEKDLSTVEKLLDQHPGLLTPALWPPAIFQAKSLEITRLLLDRGLSPDKCSAPRGPLHLAVSHGLTDVIRLLLERGASPDVLDGEHVTPIELAAGAISGERPPLADESISLLRAAGAKTTPFTQMLLREDDAVIAAIEADPDFLSKRGWLRFPPLIAAARAARPRVVEKLLSIGAKVDGTDPATNGNTALWFACQSGAEANDRLDVAKILLAAGANPSRSCEDDTTPLHFAAWRGPSAMAELLLSHGGYGWNTDRNQKTPRDYARESPVSPDREAIVALFSDVRILDPVFRSAVDCLDRGEVEKLRSILREHPGLVHQRAEEEGWYAGKYFTHPTLLHFVANNPYRNKSMPPRILESTEAILDAGADINAPTGPANAHTVLGLVTSCEIARKEGLQIPLIELLVRRGCDPSEGLDPAIIHSEMEAVNCLLRLGAQHTLMSSAALGKLEILENLLKKTPSEKERENALAAAAMYGQIPSVKALLESGPAISARLKQHPYGPTLLHQAAFFGHTDLTQWLVAQGADPTIRDLQFNGTPAGWAEHNGHPALAEWLKNKED